MINVVAPELIAACGTDRCTSTEQSTRMQRGVLLDDKRSVGGAKDQFARNCGSVVVATVAAACSGS